MRDLRVQNHIAMPAGVEAARHIPAAAAADGVGGAAAAVGGHHGGAQGDVHVMVKPTVLISLHALGVCQPVQYQLGVNKAVC